MNNLKRIKRANKKLAKARRRLEVNKYRRIQAEKGNVLKSIFGFPKRTFLILLLGIFLISLVSSLEFDNIKSYNAETKTATIKNVFGLGQDIATAKLNTPQVYYVIPSDSVKVAEIEINGYTDYSNILSSIKSYDRKNKNKEVTKNYVLKYKKSYQIPSYNSICEDVPFPNQTIGKDCYSEADYSKMNNVETWEDWNGEIKEGETLTIGLFTDVKENEHIEWIPKIAGVEVKEWADFVGMTRGEHFNTAPNDQVGANTEQHFIIGNTSANANTNVTGISINITNSSVHTGKVWITIMYGNPTTGAILNATNITYGVFDTATMNSTGFTSGHFYNITLNNSQNYGGTLSAGGTYVWKLWANYSPADGNIGFSRNTTGIYGLTNGGNVKQFEMWNSSIAALSVLLNSPPNNQAFATQNLNFSGNVSDASSLGIKNVSLLINNTVNQTNTSTLQGSYNFTSVIIPDGFWSWSIIAYDNSNVRYNATNGTLNFLVDTIQPTIDFISPTENNNSYLNRNYILTNVSSTDVNLNNITTYLYNTSLWSSQINFTSPAFNNFTGLADGVYYFNATAKDNASNSNSTETRTVTIDTTTPQIQFVSPTPSNNSIVLETYFLINVSVTETNPSNITYTLFNSTSLVNSTTYTMATALSNTTINFTGLAYDNYFYNVTITDLATNTNSTETRKLRVFPLNISSETYNASAYETNYEFFGTNIATIPEVIFVTATLNYDAVGYLVNTTCSGGTCLVNRSIDIPLVTSGENQNKTFNWSFIVYTAAGGTTINSDSHDQNVTRIRLERYNATYPNQTLNFTIWDEVSRASLGEMLMQAEFETWLGTGSVKRVSNFSVTNVTDVNFSITPANETHYVDAFIQYDEANPVTALSSGLYNKRDYHLENATLTNTSQDIRLFLLNTSLSTSFIQKVITDTQQIIEGALVMSQRYYPDTNSYETVQIYKTDDNGQTVGFFQTEIPDYRTIVVKDGEILLTTNNGKVFPQTAPYTLTFTIGSTAESIWEQFEGITSLYSNLTFNKTSGMVSYQWIDTTGGLSVASKDLVRVYPVTAQNLYVALVAKSTYTPDANTTGFTIGVQLDA